MYHNLPYTWPQYNGATDPAHETINNQMPIQYFNPMAQNYGTADPGFGTMNTQMPPQTLHPMAQYHGTAHSGLGAMNTQMPTQMYPHWHQYNGYGMSAPQMQHQNMYAVPPPPQMPTTSHHLTSQMPYTPPQGISTPALSDAPNKVKPGKRKRNGHFIGGNLMSSIPLMHPTQGQALHSEVLVYLKNMKMWDQLHAHINEMFVEPDGRDLFPKLGFTFENLKDTSHYALSIQLVRTSGKQYRYDNKKLIWVELEGEDTENVPVNSTEIFTSVMTGEVLMAPGGYTFSHLKGYTVGKKKKLDRSLSDADKEWKEEHKRNTMMLMTSGYKYTPVLKVYEVGMGNAYRMEVCSKRFQETEFIAVTKYKNSKINALKSAANPLVTSGTKRKAKDKLAAEVGTATEGPSTTPTPPFDPNAGNDGTEPFGTVLNALPSTGVGSAIQSMPSSRDLDANRSAPSTYSVEMGLPGIQWFLKK